MATGALTPTPRQGAGPFYPVELPLDNDNDLTRVAGREGVADGKIGDLSGRLLDVNGQPLPGMRLEIWQCDANGRYRHPRDTGGMDPDLNFQGHGHTLTDDEGRYRFRTIRPVPYPGRTPHIHFAVFPETTRPFTSQLYVRGDPGNAEDFLYQRIPSDLRRLVTADFALTGEEGVAFRADFDIVLGAIPRA
jgi:protocatechuate 3,4-dioxygenase beta subunit